MDEIRAEMRKYLAKEEPSTPTQESTPKPFKFETKPYLKNLSRTEFDKWSTLTGKDAEKCWNVYQSLQNQGKHWSPSITSAELAEAAVALAREHFPEHKELATTYIHIRWLYIVACELESVSWEIERGIELITKEKKDIRDIYNIPSSDTLSYVLHSTAAKLVKAGWKNAKDGSFKGTEFQKVAILSRGIKFNDKDAPCLDDKILCPDKLNEALAKL